MSFLDKAKSLVWEDAKTTSVVKQETKQLVAQPVSNQQFVAPVLSVGLNDDMLKHITSVAQKRNTSYSAFMTAENSLVDVITDQFIRMKAAAKVTVNDSRTAQKIIDDIALHINDIESDRMAAITAFQSEQSNTTNTISSNISQLESNIAEKQKQVAALTEQITKLGNDIVQSSAQLEPMKVSLQTETERFKQVMLQYEAASNHVKQGLLDRKQAITSTII